MVIVKQEDAREDCEGMRRGREAVSAFGEASRRVAEGDRGLGGESEGGMCNTLAGA